MTTAQSEVGALKQVLLHHARDAFRDRATIDAQWGDLGFAAPPDLGRAIEQFEQFAGLLKQAGARIDMMPASPGLTLDAVYVRDAAVVSDRGVVLCHMGKARRRAEPAAQGEFLRALGLPVLGEIKPPGLLEGGDVVWLDPRTVAIGRGYRTNAEGIRQLHDLLGDAVDTVIAVALPHWRGPGDVFHLMSIISPIDRDLAVVYSPLMSVGFRERLIDRGVTLVEVPHEEFETMGANVLAIAPRRCVMLVGNPRTRQALERHGVEVFEYDGSEISLKGGGGPTCLTRPLARAV
jgi:N-dimethylarginine dimethylaminohydrolase